MRNSTIVVSIVALGLSMGTPNANAARIVTANETGTPPESGLVNDIASLSDSIVGLLCSANEDSTACFATPYTVDASFISPAFRANGGAAGVNLLDGPASPSITCNPSGVLDPSCSDQLYVTVSAPSATGLYTLTWCWDSDRELSGGGTPLICPIPTGAILTNVAEPAFGFLDLTQNFAGANLPLAVGQWQILAQSEAPEPTPLFLFGGGLVVGALCLRKRRVSPPDDLSEAAAAR
jgi:hypothetical protein